MGYTHYWDRQETINAKTFKKIVKDFEVLLPLLNAVGVKLADGFGKGKAKINNKELIFNGVEKCGHTKRDLGITFPSANAKGVGMVALKESDVKENKLEGITNKDGQMMVLTGDPLEWVKNSDVSGSWFAGAKLDTRACSGDCSHETFYFPQADKNQDCQERRGKHKLFFNCTKTAYKPYDLAVICALIIAKQHLGEKIKVGSDGDINQWADGMAICEKILGYGLAFSLDEGDEE